MQINDDVINPSNETRRIRGVENTDMTGDQKLKLQYTGPGADIMFNEGPPTGKKWRVELNFTVYESNI